MALIRTKWNRFGRYVYLVMLLLYICFLVFLTMFTVSSPAPYSAKQIIDYSPNMANNP